MKHDIFQRLPNVFHPDQGEKVPHGLIGSKVVGFSAADGGGVEGGGLVIDFIPAGTKKAKRLVLAFNELGMWVESLTVAAPKQG